MFQIKINVASINASVKYKTCYNYTDLKKLEHPLFMIEFFGDKHKLSYRLPKPVFQFVESENELIGGSGFNITALAYNLDTKLTMFVSVSRNNYFKGVNLL